MLKLKIVTVGRTQCGWDSDWDDRKGDYSRREYPEPEGFPPTEIVVFINLKTSLFSNTYV